MKLGTLRGLVLSIVTMACSTDVIVVATLDGAAGASAGSDAGNNAERSGEANAGAPAAGRMGGAAGASGVDDSSAAGGTRGTLGPSSEGGTGSGSILQGTQITNVCTCLDDRSFVCGADGVTYDPTCPDGCSVITIACFHACPCDGGASGAASVDESSWVNATCFDTEQCATGSLCITANSDHPPPPCGP